MATSAIDFSSIGGKPVPTQKVDFSSIGGKPVDQQQQQPNGVSNFLTNAGEALGIPKIPDHPLDQAIADTKQLFTHPIDTAKQYLVDPLVNMVKAPGETLQSGVADIKRGDVSKGLAKSVDSVIPMVGPSMAKATEQLTSGDYSGATGTLAGLGAGIAAPEVVPATSKAARGFISNQMGKVGTKISPAAVEGALGIRGPDRARLVDKTAIGKTVLDDMKGNSPEELLGEANEKITGLGQQLDELADSSQMRGSLKPAYDALDQIEQRAGAQNSANELKVVQKIRDQLSSRYDSKTKKFSGDPIPTEPSARELLDLKRGIGKLKNWDSPSEAALASPIVDQVYGALDSELDRIVPESQGLNQKLSAMMKIASRAEDLTNNAGVAQKGFARIAAHTGAMAAPVGVGAALGGAIGGTPGAAAGSVIGSMVGPFIQEKVASPATRIGIARALYPERGSIAESMAPGSEDSGLQNFRPRGSIATLMTKNKKVVGSLAAAMAGTQNH